MIAEATDLHVSGVIAVVVMGLVVGLLGRSHMENYETICAFWEVLEFLADILVFSISGVIVYEGLRRVRTAIVSHRQAALTVSC